MSTPPHSPYAHSSAPLLDAVRHVLRPLVGLLVDTGIGFETIVEMLRHLYVERAVATAGDTANDTVLTKMTGLSRQTVSRLRSAEMDSTPHPPLALEQASLILARWLGDAAYLNESGVPASLPRGAIGTLTAPSFRALVESVTTDIPPSVVLQEWLAQGVVTLEPNGKIRLQARAILPHSGSPDLAYYFGRNLHDHIAAAVANLQAGEQPRPYLERSVHYDGLTEEAASRLEEAGRLVMERLMSQINELALDLLARGGEAALGQTARRVNVGSYMFTATEPPSRQSATNERLR